MNNSVSLVTEATPFGALGAAGPVAAVTLIRTAAVALTIAIPLVVNPFGPDAYAAMKVQVLYGLVGMMLITWAVAAIPTSRMMWRLTPAELAVWVFWLAVLVSSLTSANLRLTIFGGPGRYEGVLTTTACVALFFVVAEFFGSASGVRWLARAIGAGAVIIVGYGLAQLALPPLFEGEEIIRSWYGSIGLPRIISTLGSPIVFGGYLTVTIPLILALGLSPAPRPARIFWLCVSGAGYVAVMATSTRAAWFAMAVATPMFLALAGQAVWRQHKRMLLAGGSVVLIIAAALLMRTGAASAVASRATSTLALEVGSVGQRMYIWEQTISLIRQRPWLGWGLETLREVFPYERSALVKIFGVRPVIIDRAHNDFLQVAVSVGVPGAVAYGAVWVLVLLSAVRAWRRVTGPPRVLAAGFVAALVGYLVQAQFSFSSVAVTPLIWLLAGAVSGWESITRDDKGPSARQEASDGGR